MDNQPVLEKNEGGLDNTGLLENAANNKQRHFLAVFFYSFIWGTFGVDRFYLGKIWTGILKLITFGGFGFWTMIDLSLIMSGVMRDKHGNEMLEHERYKKLAGRTVMWFGVIVVTSFLIVGAIVVYSVTQFIQSGGIDGLIKSVAPNSINQLPDANKIQEYLNIYLN